MSWVNVGNIKGDTGASGGSAFIRLDSAHGIIYLGDQDYSYTIALSSLKGPKGDTGPAGPVNLVSTLDTADTANAVTCQSCLNIGYSRHSKCSHKQCNSYSH